MGRLSSFITRGAEAVPLLFGGDSYLADAPWRDLWVGRFRARHADCRSRTRHACPKGGAGRIAHRLPRRDRKSTRLNSSHGYISYAVFCLKKKKKKNSTAVTRT